VSNVAHDIVLSRGDKTALGLGHAVREQAEGNVVVHESARLRGSPAGEVGHDAPDLVRDRGVQPPVPESLALGMHLDLRLRPSVEDQRWAKSTGEPTKRCNSVPLSAGRVDQFRNRATLLNQAGPSVAMGGAVGLR
jgi:hypothetical protein